MLAGTSASHEASALTRLYHGAAWGSAILGVQGLKRKNEGA